MTETLIRNSDRVAELGEVFTPKALVKEIVDLVPAQVVGSLETNCLDPACGHGQFLLDLLGRKLVTARSEADDAEGWRYCALQALTRVHGVDIEGEVNIPDARRRMLAALLEEHQQVVGEAAPEPFEQAARVVLGRNIIRADFIKDDFRVTEWTPVGDGQFTLTTSWFSRQLGPEDPRAGNLFACDEHQEGPIHWRDFKETEA